MLRAADQLSFQPNVLARGLISGRTGTIGLITVDLNLEQLGATAVKYLFAALDGTVTSGVIRQPCRLVVRESTAPARA